ncbi:hypothetical protein OH76DRAFT_1103336 [Lentinus brumalis]|uniref:Uncharacterized protein n=1 Tax=Lentinus brumalis TaxID=2498619 RepID=A0A371CVQ4_9APHY|nr:hypothetical protein OH76DRAFT_1103336 [Polyporus brumalis]
MHTSKKETNQPGDSPTSHPTHNNLARTTTSLNPRQTLLPSSSSPVPRQRKRVRPRVWWTRRGRGRRDAHRERHAPPHVDVHGSSGGHRRPRASQGYQSQCDCGEAHRVAYAGKRESCRCADGLGVSEGACRGRRPSRRAVTRQETTSGDVKRRLQPWCTTRNSTRTRARMGLKDHDASLVEL